MTYSIGETAKILGVNPSTLRYYDKEGLLPFVSRTDGGIRVFKENDMEWLKLIECLKKTNMPIKEIKRFIDLYEEGDHTAAQRLEIIRNQKESVEAQIKQLQSTLEVLEYKNWFYETAVRLGTCDIYAHLKPDEITATLPQKGNRRGVATNKATLQRKGDKHQPGEVQRRIDTVHDGIAELVQVQTKHDVAGKVHETAQSKQKRVHICRTARQHRQPQTTAQRHKRRVDV